MITSLSELYFRFTRFILLEEMKKVISMNHSSSTSKWKSQRWLRFDLMLMMKDIYIVTNSNLNPLIKFTSSRSTEFKENGTSPMEHLSNDRLEHHNQHGNNHNLCIDMGILFWVYRKVNGNSENSTIRISQWKERHCRTNTSIRRKKEIQKSRNVKSHSQGSKYES